MEVMLETIYVCFAESTKWIPTEKVQEQQRLAETLGRLHQLLPLLLQNLPGRNCRGKMNEIH